MSNDEPRYWSYTWPGILGWWRWWRWRAGQINGRGKAGGWARSESSAEAAARRFVDRIARRQQDHEA